MRIISKKTLKDFYEQKEYADSKTSLEAWHKEAINSNWQNPNDIKIQYKSASVVGNPNPDINIESIKINS